MLRRVVSLTSGGYLNAMVARELIGRSHQLTLCKAIDLDDGTVHIKIQLGAVLPDLLDLSDRILDVVNDMIPRRNRQTKALEIV